MRLVLPCLLLLCAAPAWADPPRVVPVPRADPGEWAEVAGEPGRLLVLQAEPASKWLLVDESADLREFESGRYAAFVGPAGGRYRLIVTGPDGTPARVCVVVGDAPPGPGPKPPDPPADPLRARLKQAYDADAGAGKDRAALDLAELYRQAAALAADPAVKTAGDLLRRAKAASDILVGSDELVAARKVVAAELAALFPADGELTAAQRTAAAALFTRLGTILDELGGE